MKNYYPDHPNKNFLATLWLNIKTISATGKIILSGLLKHRISAIVLAAP